MKTTANPGPAGHKNERLIAKIEERLQTLNMSPRAASLEVGQNPDLLRNILSGRAQNPRMDTLRKIAKALKTSEEWLLEGADESMSSAPEVDRSAATAPTQTDMMRDIPVMGTARGSAIHEDFEGFDINGPVDYVHRPPALAGAKDIYAIYVAGDSMAPQHSAGELRFAHPHRPVQPGCTIIIQTRKENGDPGQAYIKNLVRRSAGKVTVEQINPPATIDIPTESIVKMHRVLTLNELFGI